MNDFLLIALNGLPSGKTFLEGKLDEEFFASFENTEILDADVSVGVCLEKSGSYTGIDISVRGTVTVECDRCLEALELPVERDILLEVKFGKDGSDGSGEGEREVLFLSQDNAEIDLSQTVYDYVCTSLPIQRHHKDGECNPEVMKYLCIQDESEPRASQMEDSPFASLGSLLNERGQKL